MAEKFVFDAAGVEALEAGDRERRAWDGALPGLGIRIRPSGTKSWIVNARTTGTDGKVRSRRVTLGKCGEMSLEEARAEARKLLAADAAAAEALPAAGMADGAARGGGDGGGEPAPKTDAGGPAGADDDGRAAKSAAAASRAVAGSDRSGAVPATDPAQSLEDIHGRLDRIEASGARTEAQLELVSSTVAVIAGDHRRKRWRAAGVVLAVFMTAAAGFGGGAYIQSREAILPQADPTRGWKDHFWKYYGRAFQDCFDRAKESESGYAQCEVRVRGR